jgi:uncharacterized membrane protein YdjX (TVP38/TMEM64 family)
VLYSRIAPGPSTLLNYAAAPTNLSYGHMALGTLLGTAPRVLAYVTIGASLGNLDKPPAIAAIALLVVLAIIGFVLGRRQVARSKSAAHEDD